MNTPATTEPAITYVAWTGGFDSTHLLCRTLSLGRCVQPVFIPRRIDGRQSAQEEWQTVKALWRILDARWPGQLKPPVFVRILPEVEMASARTIIGNLNRKLNIAQRVGGQYEALIAVARTLPGKLAVAAESGGIFERAYHSDIFDPGTWDVVLDVLDLPLIDDTRAQMLLEAAEHGWLGLLRHTWSCRFPSGGKPCGCCSSCRNRSLDYAPLPELEPAVDVSIIIPAWASETFNARIFARCVSQCARALKESGLRGELIVVPGDLPGAKLPPGTKCVELGVKDNLGAARNAGAAKAKGDVLFFLDADCLMSPAALAAAIKHARDGKAAMPVVYAQGPDNNGCWRGTLPTDGKPGGTGSCGIMAMGAWLWNWTGGWPEYKGWGREDQVMRDIIGVKWPIARYAEPGIVHVHHEPQPGSPGIPANRFREAPMLKETKRLLRVTRSKPRPSALLLADVRKWAFDKQCREIATACSGKLNCDVAYVRDLHDGLPFPDPDDYDVVLECYPWLQTSRLIDPARTIGCLWHTYLFLDEPQREPGDKEYAHVNKYSRFLVCNRQLQRWYNGTRAPKAVYLPIPVDMELHPDVVTDFSEIKACWAGNGRRGWKWDGDTKGLHETIIPGCATAGVPLELADYHKGRLDPGDMPAWYLKSNVYVCASSHEGCSNSINEALASGMVVVSTNVGQVPEIVENQHRKYGKSGILVIEKNADNLVEALRTLRSLPAEELAEMGRINRAEVAEGWSWQVLGDAYVALLLEVARGR